jgi:hypothetical protein
MRRALIATTVLPLAIAAGAAIFSTTSHADLPEIFVYSGSCDGRGPYKSMGVTRWDPGDKRYHVTNYTFSKPLSFEEAQRYAADKGFVINRMKPFVCEQN